MWEYYAHHRKNFRSEKGKGWYRVVERVPDECLWKEFACVRNLFLYIHMQVIIQPILEFAASFSYMKNLHVIQH